MTPEVQRDRELIRQALEEAGSCAISHVERVQNKLRPLPVEPKTVTLPSTTRQFRCVQSEFSGKWLFQYRDNGGSWVDFYWAEDLRLIASLLPPSTDTQEETTRRYTVDEICAKVPELLARVWPRSYGMAATSPGAVEQDRINEMRKVLRKLLGDSTP